MVCSPAKISSAVYPMCRHTLISAIVGMTVDSWDRKGIVFNPIEARTWFPIPSWVSRIHMNTSAATTLETRYGVSTMERTQVDWVSLCINTAMSRASTVWTPMLTTT